MLKSRILGVVVLVILMIVVILGVTTFILTSNADKLYRQSSQQATLNLLNKIVASVIDKMKINAMSLTRNSETLAALQEKNAEVAMSASIGTFNRLSTGGVIDALLLLDPQGNLLASHGTTATPGSIRSVLMDSVRTATKSASGLERDTSENPVARFVFPLLQRGELVGIAVFEKGFASILDEFNQASSTKTAVMGIDNAILLATDKELFSALSGEVKQDTTGYLKFSYGKTRYGITTVLLRDNDSKPLGVFVAAKDNTEAYTHDIQITTIAVVVSLAVFLLCIGFLRHYIRSAFGPLDRMVEVMRHVQKSGDFSERAPIHNPGDEVGVASTSFNELLSRIAEVIHQVQQSSVAISDAAEIMSTSGAKVTQGTAAQSAAADQVAAVMEQTAISISATADNATMANDVAQRAQAGIEHSVQAMQEALVNVDQVASLIRNASSNITQLDDSSKKIGGIIQVIRDIADQTNLLALNAAIEAARAGEQGRGFAVVADEVRKLAEGTSKATNEIGGLISSIQAQINSAVVEMRNANTQTDRGLALVGQTEATLRSVGSDSSTAANNMRAIADAVREQDTAVHQVADSIGEIARIIDENSTAAAAAAGVALHLDELANRLRTSVVNFKTAA